MKVCIENNIVVAEVHLPDLLGERFSEFIENIWKFRSEGWRKYLYQVFGGHGFTDIDGGLLISYVLKQSRAGYVVAVYPSDKYARAYFARLGYRISHFQWFHNTRDEAIKYLETHDPGEAPHL